MASKKSYFHFARRVMWVSVISFSFSMLASISNSADEQPQRAALVAQARSLLTPIPRTDDERLDQEFRHVKALNSVKNARELFAYWKVYLEQATGETLYNGVEADLVRDMGQLYDQDKFRTPESKRLQGRAKKVAREEIDAWVKACTKALGEENYVGKNRMLALLIQQEGLFAAETYRSDVAKRWLGRIPSIPRSALDDVTKCGRYHLTATLIALAQLDDLYDDRDGFQDTAWQRLVADLKKSPSELVTQAEANVAGDAAVPKVQPQEAIDWRIWTNRDGRKLDAAFLRVLDGVVTIRRRSDGKVFSIPLEQLSEDDQRWVQRAGSRNN